MNNYDYLIGHVVIDTALSREELSKMTFEIRVFGDDNIVCLNANNDKIVGDVVDMIHYKPKIFLGYYYESSGYVGRLSKKNPKNPNLQIINIYTINLKKK